MVEAASAQHEIAVIRYLDEKPSRADLVMLATTLDGAPGDLVRRDPEFHEMRCDESTLEDIDVVVDLALVPTGSEVKIAGMEIVEVSRLDQAIARVKINAD